MSMQIVEKSGEGLSRVYGVKVSAKELGAEAGRAHRRDRAAAEPEGLPPRQGAGRPTCAASTASR